MPRCDSPCRNVTGISFIVGVSLCLETFCSQACAQALSTASTSPLRVPPAAAPAARPPLRRPWCAPPRPQANGAKNYPALGIYLQRALLLNLVACVLSMLVWARMEDILLACGQVHAPLIS